MDKQTIAEEAFKRGYEKALAQEPTNWIYSEFFQKYYCQRCTCYVDQETPYCPYCGSKKNIDF